LLGTAEEVTSRLRRLEAGGVETVLLVDPKATPASLRAFAEEVMPAFKTERAAAE
jgi:alkanesulfonate monooxygenase SsuD/methylene tetrahydromethanopterin reductase-like flavin-dependent oxidoreductase (luciferase family)